MNTNTFKQPIELMENIMNVTQYLRNKIIENKGNPERETLNVILTKDQKPYYIDKIISTGDHLHLLVIQSVMMK